MTDRTLQQHIEDDMNELDNPGINSQRRRHIESELEELQSYQNNHPEETHDPTPLELYCDLNPNALECRIYED
jgi:hypothetical protein